MIHGIAPSPSAYEMTNTAVPSVASSPRNVPKLCLKRKEKASNEADAAIPAQLTKSSGLRPALSINSTAKKVANA